MSRGESVSAAIAFEQFIEHLRRNGFVIGVDSHLRIQELLNRVGGSYGPEDLKTLVCPLVARSEDEQEAFYEAFRRFYPEFEISSAHAPLAGIADAAPQPTGSGNRRWRWAFLTLVAVAVLGVLLI